MNYICFVFKHPQSLRFGLDDFSARSTFLCCHYCMVLSTSDVVLSGCTVVFLLLLFLAWQLPQFLSLNRFQVFPVTKEPTFFLAVFLLIIFVLWVHCSEVQRRHPLMIYVSVVFQHLNSPHCFWAVVTSVSCLRWGRATAVCVFIVSER